VIASDETLERMQADGKITVHDADEIRNFGSFLAATAGIPRAAEHRTPEQARTFAKAYREHYPEDFARQQAAAEPQEACGSCGETPENECPASKRPCGHHCNHVWTHDTCDWCGKEFGEDPQA
jgi:hypothetical protein